MKNLIKRINLEKVFNVYPISFGLAIITSLFLLFLSEELVARTSLSYSYAVRLTWVFSLLFPCVLLFEILAEKSNKKNWIYLGICVLIGLLYFFYLPQYPSIREFIRHLVLIGVIHFLIILVPYIKSNESDSFWHNFIYSLMLFLEATIFTLFLMGTLTLAIVAITELFGVEWGDFKIYQNLVIVLIAVFHPLYALSRFRSSKERNSYVLPQVVNIFSSKILFPVVLLYAAILAAYMIKILLEWTWPNGWISSMILWFAVLGTAAFAFIRYKTESLNRIELIYRQWYFPFLFMCTIVLSMAIRLRVLDYGITEPRYIVMSLAFFLFVISLYFSFSKAKDLRAGLYLFAVSALFIVFSPWNVFDIPVKSQLSRMTKLLNAEVKDNIGLSQILLFLNQRNALDELNSLDGFEDLVESPSDEVKLETMLIYRGEYHDYNRYDNLLTIAENLGFKYEPYRVINDFIHFNFNTNLKQELDVSRYRQMVMINSRIEKDTDPGPVYLSTDKAKLVLN
ncbi:MAG: DUF4153 domain-containing protein, partial [Saprospiraceae bacterium]|nr:DUF4153 domain-containing protein [Saprospiraceae bacterium]